jgi:uncharacterized protein YacL
MLKRALWTTFTLLFMIAGAAVGPWLARMYMQGLTTGRWFGHAFGRPEAGVPDTARVPAMVAFGVAGMLVGFLVSTVVHSQLQRLRRGIETMSVQDKVAVVTGLLIGLLLTLLIAASIQQLPPVAKLAIAVFLCYLGVTATLSMKEQLRLYFPAVTGQGKYPALNVLRPKILDTNVIIDGRIADICKAGFVEGPIYIPRFVLDELQQIADSSDSLKRARGRRGLDILNQMQQEMSLQIETYDSPEAGSAEDVDGKLVQLAKDLNGAIVTNDYNLNKIAGLHGIKVLNVNELANALKPVVLPGEEMTVTVIKEGKEQNQGVGYLDDGTMIVVEHGKRHIGETLTVMVTSILQTAAGKMIFADLRSERQEGEALIERNVRSYSGGRQRRKVR